MIVGYGMDWKVSSYFQLHFQPSMPRFCQCVDALATILSQSVSWQPGKTGTFTELISICS